MKVELEKPITEWCRNCDYTDSYHTNRIRSKCPECGERDLNHGVKLPNKGLIGCYSYVGQFNLMSNEEQTQYVFTNLPEDVFGCTRKGFVVDDCDLDTSCPQSLALELKEIIDGYLYNSDKTEIEKLVNYLNDDFMEKHDRKKDENRLVELKSELYWLLKALEENK